MKSTHVLGPVNVYPVTLAIRELDPLLIELYSPRAVVHVKNRVTLLKLERHKVTDGHSVVVGHRAEIEDQTVVEKGRYLETCTNKMNLITVLGTS